MAPEARGLIGPLDHHQRAALTAAHFGEFGRERLEDGAACVPVSSAAPRRRLGCDLSSIGVAQPSRGAADRDQRADFDRDQSARAIVRVHRCGDRAIPAPDKRSASPARRPPHSATRSAMTFGLGQNTAGIDHPGDGVGRHVLENRIETALVEQRRNQFDAGEQQSIFERLGQFRGFLAHHADFRAAQARRDRPGLVAQDRRRHQASADNGHLIDFAQRALARRVEMANRSDDVLFEFDAYRVVDRAARRRRRCRRGR